MAAGYIPGRTVKTCTNNFPSFFSHLKSITRYWIVYLHNWINKALNETVANYFNWKMKQWLIISAEKGNIDFNIIISHTITKSRAEHILMQCIQMYLSTKVRFACTGSEEVSCLCRLRPEVSVEDPNSAQMCGNLSQECATSCHIHNLLNKNRSSVRMTLTHHLRLTLYSKK